METFAISNDEAQEIKEEFDNVKNGRQLYLLYNPHKMQTLSMYIYFVYSIFCT